VIGVVACEALYSAVERLAPDARVRYVPPDLHEFPVNVPDEKRVSAAVQERIDGVDDPDLDRIVVVYADDGESLAGVRSEHAPLVVARSTDCISAFLGDADGATGERKAFGTYYLSRGWIDCAVDSYKLYCAYTGEDGALLDDFERAAAAHPGVRVTWNEGEMYERAVEAQDRVSGDQVGRFVHRIVEYYEHVRLVDTGDLHPFHREYAERFRAFVERLSREYGDAHAVDLAEIEGDEAFLRTLLSSDSDEGGSEHVETYPPGSPVE